MAQNHIVIRKGGMHSIILKSQNRTRIFGIHPISERPPKSSRVGWYSLQIVQWVRQVFEFFSRKPEMLVAVLFLS